MEKFAGPDETLPGLTTVIVTLPVPPVKFAGTVARSWVAPAKVVESEDLFHCTVAPARNPVPFTVRVKAAPGVVEGGFRSVMVGADTDGLMEKLIAPEVTLPGFVTVIGMSPGLETKPAGTSALSCVAPATDVESRRLFHRTTAPGWKPVPVTVRVKGAPAVAEPGLRLLMVGISVSGLMEKLTGLDRVFPGFTAVTVALPGLAIRLAGTWAVISS